MLNKKEKILLFIFMILFCVAAVNAESIGDNSQSVDIVDVKSDSYVATIADESAVGSFSALNTTINSESSQSEIQLTMNYTYNEETDSDFKNGININKTVTIDGQGHTIDGNYSARIFNVTNGASLTLKNIKLINANSLNYGGAISNLGGGDLTIINSTFHNNRNKITLSYGTRGGGAICSTGKVIVKNSTFSNNVVMVNESAHSSSLSIDAFGGAIYVTNDITVVNSTFSNNLAIANSNNLSSASSYTYGGAIYVGSSSSLSSVNINIVNSTFSNNSAISNCNVNATIDSYNNAYSYSFGGAIYVYYGNITVVNSVFSNNSAISTTNADYSEINDNSNHHDVGSYSYGGAICTNYYILSSNHVNITIINSVFSNNSALSKSNANYDKIINSNDHDYDVDSKSYGGAIYTYYGNITITSSVFSNNSAISKSNANYEMTNDNDEYDLDSYSYGGAIFTDYYRMVDYGHFLIVNSTFSNNIAFSTVSSNIPLIQASSSGDGGAIYAYGNITLINSKFLNNTASGSNTNNRTNSIYGNGGAIYMDSSGNMYVNNSIFANNFAYSIGGAISSGDMDTIINNSTFINNSVSYEGDSIGGAVYGYGNMNVTNSVFTNNSAFIGGALFNENFTYIFNSTFTDNNAFYGSALVHFGNVNITQSTFIGNNATEGGAIYGFGNLTLTDSKFRYNNASYGGALNEFGRFIITNCEFTGNKAEYGGAICYTDENTFVKLIIEYYKHIMSPEEYEATEEFIKEEYNMTMEEYFEMTFRDDYPEWFNNISFNEMIVFNSNFSQNHGQYGDDIFTVYNTTVYNNTYTKNSYANIYANNTIVNCTIVSVLDNGTYYVTIGKMFKVKATVLADGASINGYNLTITDGTNNYSAEYMGYGIYEITGEILADFEIRHYSAIVNSQTDSNRYAVNNGTVIVNDKRDLEIEVELDPAVAGGNITGNITLRDENGEIANVTGEVTIEINGKNYTANVTEGKGTFNIEDEFGPGNYTMDVTFPGNEDYNPAETSKDFTIEDNRIILEVHDLTKYYGNSSKLIILLTDSHGNPLVNQEVTITINGVTYTRMTDSEGKIQMSINLIPGIYETEVSYGNITKNVTVTVLTTIEAEDLVKYFKNGTQYYAKFYNVDGTPLANTNVTFNIHGVFYTRTTDENGIAKLNINLNPGEYIITAWNPVNNESKANAITVLSTIFGENVIKFYRNGTQYYAYVLDENGNPLANANVTFNIHGVFYNRTSNEEGIVKLNINLNPGEYIITAWNLWNGEAKSNNITVYTVVKSQNLEMTTSDRKPFKVTILGEQGEPLANANVTFNIHGVFYHRTTDANGQISLNINLIAGKYIITTYYNEYSISNTIVVK